MGDDCKSNGTSFGQSALVKDKDEKFQSDVRALNQTFYNHLTKFMQGQDKIYDYTIVCEEYINYIKQLKEEKNSSPVSTATLAGLLCLYCYRICYLK